MRYRVIVTNWGISRVWMRNGSAALFDTRTEALRTVALALGYGHQDLLCPEKLAGRINVIAWPAS